MLVLQKMQNLWVLDQWGAACAAALDISVDEFTQVGFLLETLTLTVDSSRRKDLSKS